jgi:hypothetical protein
MPHPQARFCPQYFWEGAEPLFAKKGFRALKLFFLGQDHD